jgi:hypothetical protein
MTCLTVGHGGGGVSAGGTCATMLSLRNPHGFGLSGLAQDDGVRIIFGGSKEAFDALSWLARRLDPTSVTATGRPGNP